MIFSVVFIAITLLPSKAEEVKKYGCLKDPEICRSQYQLCVDDGAYGMCTLKSRQSSSDEYRRLVGMVHHVQRFLLARNIDFSDLSESELNMLAKSMARVYIEKEKALEKAKIEQTMMLLRSAQKDLLPSEVSYDDLNNTEKQIVLDAGAQFVTRKRKSKTDASSAKSHPVLFDSNDNGGSQIQPDPDSLSDNVAIVNYHSQKNALDRSHDVIISTTVDSPDVRVKENDPSINNIQDKRKNDIKMDVRSDTAVDRAKESFTRTEEKGLRQEPSGSTTDDVEFVKKTKRDETGAGTNGEATYIIVITLIVAVLICVVVVAVVIFCMKSAAERQKLFNETSTQPGEDYQALCRQHYASKTSEKSEVQHPLITKQQSTGSVTSTKIFSPTALQRSYQRASRNSSVSSWSEEPITTTLDISTGHAVLSYMEDHLNNKDRLTREWEALCSYKADNVTTDAAHSNARKNRSQYAVPYDHNRVTLHNAESADSLQGDYINASFIIDNDPRWPLYIATQGPLTSTVHHFWQMIWEQRCVVIVMLTPLIEDGASQCARYWPDEGSSTYNDFEIHLVSEHIWCEDYLVRSLYLKNLNSGETRTVTQFHFLSWPVNGIPPSSKQLLELRRKVSKCYKGNALSPIVVHCSDGSGRTGSYILLDLVIARMVKGTCKEIDIAATLEHLRDQRPGMVSTKDQLEFALTCVADEVNAILKVLLQ